MLVHELMKVWTLRSTRVGAALVLVVTALLAFATARALQDDPTGPAGAVEILQLVLRTSSPSLVLGLIIGVGLVRAEVRDGVLRASLLRCPRRDRLLLAKAGATALVSGGWGVVCALAATAMTHLVGGALPAGAWVVGILAHGTVATGWGLLGLCAGVLVRHQAGAVAGALALPFVLEPALGGALGADRAALLPFRSVSGAYGWLGDSASVTSVSPLPTALALVPFLLLLAAAAALSRARFRALEA